MGQARGDGRGGGRGRGRGGAGVRESDRAPVSGPAPVCKFWRQGTCTHGSSYRIQHVERGGGGEGGRDAADSAPAAAATERRPPEVALARGAHPSSPVGTELTEAEIAEVLAAVSRADAGHGSTSRKLGPGGVRTFLAELQRDPTIASVLAKNDFREVVFSTRGGPK